SRPRMTAPVESAPAVAAPIDDGFRPVARETLSSQIRDRLLDRITTGAWQPGARVPSERDLSEQFQVARTSVREAIQGLVSLGVIERRGNRSFVVEHLPDVSFDAIDDRKEFIRQLFEARRLLEIPMLRLAAQRATDAERAEVRSIAERFRADMTLAEFRELDRAFHGSIAHACANPILVEMYHKVMHRLFHSEELSSLLGDQANRVAVAHIVGEAAEQHGRLAAAVAAGDEDCAAAEGELHLAEVERSLIDRLV
ncbi:MAG: FCD domain-containing protein, partial [Actinomycetota bacterium]